MKIRVPALLLLVLLALGSAAPAAEPLDHEGVLEEILDALRSGSRASMQAFLDRRFGGDDSMDTLEFMSTELGREFRFHRVIERSDDRIVGLVSAGERWIGVVLEFRDDDGGLTGIGLRRADPPSDNAVAAATRSELVRETAVWLKRGYVLPDVGPRMADAIVGRLESGAYDELTSPDALAIRLTDDLRDIYPDKHLTVLTPAAFQRRQKMLSEHSGGHGDAMDPDRRHRWYEHGGIADLWWKESGRSVAVLEFSALAEGPDSFETVRRALQEMSQRDGLVFDLRGVPGGDASVVQEVISHFIDHRERMARMETVDPHTGERSVRNEWVEPGVLSAKLRGKPVYVLVDSRTASAAEALAGLLKRLGGATVVGERTAGAGHMTTTVPLAAGFGLQLPTGRGVGDDGFEGQGLRPDIAVPPQDALQVALARLGVAG
jgi:hypothetical protein